MALLSDFDRTFAVLEHGDGYNGVGWYYWDENYPEEGSVGAFSTRAEAEAHAREAEYEIKPYDCREEPNPIDEQFARDYEWSEAVGAYVKKG